MFLLAYYEAKKEGQKRTVAIMGLPGCVMYAKRTIFDLVLPRVMAEDEVHKEELAALGQGGLCRDLRHRKGWEIDLCVGEAYVQGHRKRQ